MQVVYVRAYVNAVEDADKFQVRYLSPSRDSPLPYLDTSVVVFAPSQALYQTLYALGRSGAVHQSCDDSGMLEHCGSPFLYKFGSPYPVRTPALCICF